MRRAARVALFIVVVWIGMALVYGLYAFPYLPRTGREWLSFFFVVVPVCVLAELLLRHWLERRKKQRLANRLDLPR